MNSNKTIVVAMSGGVDSSVAAALLVEQGYHVIGMMLRLWSEPGMEMFNRCCTPEAMSLARRVAAHLDIPFYAVDIRETFYQNIVQFFIDGYAEGITPNPCMMCNRHIRFGALLDKALALGADKLATGHYAQVQQDKTGRYQLLRGVDAHKDQSYVLSVLNQQQLSHALFPVGGIPKPEVRELARRFNLPVADRSDSQDLCFLAGDDYRNFLQRNAPQLVSQPGDIVTPEGKTLGTHNGLALYTIGQRKGLGIAHHVPLYVIDKRTNDNTLIVGTREQLGRSELIAKEVNWVAGHPPTEPVGAMVKIRYKAREVMGRVTPLPEQRARVTFTENLRDITPGQVAVFYVGDAVLGGGVIDKMDS